MAKLAARGGRGSLQPTALVGEVWLRLRGKAGRFANRGHYLAVASLAMRQLLANQARTARTRKREHARATVTLGLVERPCLELDVVDLDDSLNRLAELNARHARVVELRFLCGPTIAETAEVLEVSHSTVETGWAMAQARLRRELCLS